MINIDDRLKKIADLICGEYIADIGSDHAYLPIWLIQNQKIKKAYALDISENCVERAKKNIIKHGIPEDAIIPAVSNGLSCFENGFDFFELSDVVISGMGGETISQIMETIKNNFDLGGINFIFQPSRKIGYLKNYLLENNFHIKKCVIAESKKRFYAIINAVCGDSRGRI